MYTADTEHKYKKAGDLLRQEQYRASFELAAELDQSMPESSGVAMLEALNLFMLGQADQAAAACERARDRLQAIRQNGDALNDLLNDAQRRDLNKHLADQETKILALLESLRRADASTASSIALDAAIRDAVLAPPPARTAPARNRGDQVAEIGRNLQEIRGDERAGSDTSQALLQELQRLRQADAANAAELERARDADMSSETEKGLSGEIQKLQSIEDEKSRELSLARDQMRGLADDLKTREDALSQSAVSEVERDQALKQLNTELERLRTDAEHSAESEKVLSTELGRLKSIEQEQAAALSQARGEMDRLTFELTLREKIISTAEQSEAEREQQMGRLNAELDTIRREAADASASERKLAEELGHLRVAEAERMAAMEKSRQEMDALRLELEVRERAISAAQQTDAERARTIDRLNGELSGLRTEAREAADSEKNLTLELGRLRSLDTETKKDLDRARGEVDTLNESLRARERVIAASEKSESERQRTIAHLQVELDTLRRDAHETAKSKHDLAAELERLRTMESAKSAELARARTESDTLRAAVQDREKLIAVAQKSDAERGADREKEIGELQSQLAEMRRHAQDKAASEAALAVELTRIKSASAEALDQARSEVTALTRDLAARERLISDGERGTGDREKAILESQRRLEDMEARAEQKAKSEASLAAELGRFKSASAEALEKARAEMAQLQAELVRRETEIRGVESRRGDHEHAISSLQTELGQAHSRAEHKAASEAALAGELTRIREASAQALEDARRELESLRGQLTEREELMRAAESGNTDQTRGIAKLQADLDRREREAADKARSKEALEQELEKMRTLSAEALEEARREVTDLRRQLTARARVVETEEARTSLRETAIDKLQSDLERIKSEATQKARSEQALRAELERFKSASAEAMDQARREVEELERELDQRAAAVRKTEDETRRRDGEIRGLQETLDALQAAAAKHNDTERRLTQELDRVRSDKEEELRQSKNLVNQLQRELEDKGRKVQVVERAAAEREELFHSLRQSLEIIEGQPPRPPFVPSRVAAAQPAIALPAPAGAALPSLGDGAAMARDIERAQADLNTLASELEQKESLMRASAEQGVCREETLNRLQGRLDELKAGGAPEANLDDVIKEIRTLRGEQDSSEHALREARQQAESLRELISERMRKLEDRVKLASNRQFRHTPKRLVLLIIVSLLALAIVGLQFYRLGYFSNEDPARASTPTRVVRPAALDPVEPTDNPQARVTPAPRVVRFPADRALGTLSIRPWDDAGAAWRVHGDARGPISLGGDHVLKLTIPEGAAPDLAPLASIEAGALYTLEMNGPAITDAQLSSVAGLTGLRELSLEGTAVSAQGIKMLSGMTGLRTLSLRRTALAPSAGAALESIAGLEKLDLGETGLPQSVIDKLIAALPNCTIVAK